MLTLNGVKQTIQPFTTGTAAQGGISAVLHDWPEELAHSRKRSKWIDSCPLVPLANMQFALALMQVHVILNAPSHVQPEL